MTRATAAILAAAAIAPVSAHHSVVGFDGGSPVTVSGTIAEVLWQNPHAYIRVDVPGTAHAERWTIEAEAARVLQRLGWREERLTPGTPVTTTGAPARDGRPVMRCAFLRLESGERLPCHPGRND